MPTDFILGSLFFIPVLASLTPGAPGREPTGGIVAPRRQPWMELLSDIERSHGQSAADFVANQLEYEWTGREFATLLID